MAGAHIIKALLKMTSRIPYWSNALSDPKGITAAHRIVDKTLIMDKSVPDAIYPAVSYAAAALLLVALFATLLIFIRSKTVQKHRPGAKLVLFLGVLGYWCVFAMTILKWRFS